MIEDDSPPEIALPDVPPEQLGLDVAAWHEAVTIPTYDAGAPDRFPAYLSNRVYQGSSGRVYPMPFIESIADEAVDRTWSALHLQNEYLRIMVLPELGGRVHIAMDRITGEHLFYRNRVIKPALVGLAGPWISGGIEFNWPQHHRPGTYLPTDWRIEREGDGSVTIWCSDHDPFARMRGEHGIRLRPGSSVIEARVRLHNRTELTQTFLWWANVAVRVHDEYQSFFPTDVRVVADHAKRAVTTFPAANGRYYGVDYPARVDAEHPDADRLDWYRNIPVPTSYMCIGSADDFFGGYDHATDLGFVHVADHHIAPGKKQWTWGNAPFGWAWDRNLSDGDGPYVELMAGVYTDNQPDFSYLAPGETKRFSQYWYPVHGTKVPQQATRFAAARVQVDPCPAGVLVHVTLETTQPRSGVRIILTNGAERVWETTADIAPDAVFHTTAHVDGASVDDALALLAQHDGTELLRWVSGGEHDGVHEQAAATPVDAPEDIASNDELYLAGVHLQQYRHATRSPEPYWEELLRRDPLDARGNVALAERRIRDGRSADAERHLRAAIRRETRRNPNPADGTAHYLLGVVLQAADRLSEADDAFAKSAWNAAWRAPAAIARTRIALRTRRWADALRLAEEAASLDTGSGTAAALRVIALRAAGNHLEAAAAADAAATADPLDHWVVDLARRPISTDALTLVDVAREYASVGAAADALRLLRRAIDTAHRRPVLGAGNPVPMAHYRAADLLEATGDADAATAERELARAADATRAFPRDADDARVLTRAIASDDTDARAHSLLGQWLYAVDRFPEALAELRRAAELDPTDVVALRVLGLASVNVLNDLDAAARWYERAVDADPDDPKLRYESDQLASRRGVALHKRLSRLEQRLDLTLARHDTTVVFAELLVLTGRASDAVEVLQGRRFQPWEGGEGEVLRVWSLAQATLARSALDAGRADDAVAALRSAFDPPETLGEAHHPLENTADLHLLLGDALDATGDGSAALEQWRLAASSVGDFTTMATVPYSTATYAQVVAARRLGDTVTADALVDGLSRYVDELTATPATIDYFATSLPSMRTFTDDVQRRQDELVALLRAQLDILVENRSAAGERLWTVLHTDPANAVARTLLTADVMSAQTAKEPR